jgi:limonene 1,2-monooxygenase
MHLSTSEAQARQDLEWGVLRATRYLETISGEKMPWRVDPPTAVEEWVSKGLPSWGTIVAGTPDAAISGLEHLVEKSGGFGTFLLSITDCAPFHTTVRSLELFAEYVFPHFRNSNRNREDSLHWAYDNKDQFMGRMNQAVDEANQKYTR